MKALLSLSVICLGSCSGIYSGLTGQPIASAKVKRVEGPATAPEINVALQDLIRAESNPGRVYGLYDASAVADRVGELQGSSK